MRNQEPQESATSLLDGKYVSATTRKLVKDIRKGETIVHEGVSRKILGKALRMDRRVAPSGRILANPFYEFEMEGGVLLTDTVGYLEVEG